MPAISIVLATFNRAQLLPQAIASIQAQTFADWELIVVDDGSTDSTRQVVSEIQQRDPRVRYVHQENRGGAAARNMGVRAAQGMYITFKDDDDLCHLEKLAQQYQLLSTHPEYGWMYGFMDVENLVTGERSVHGRVVTTYRELFSGYFIGTPTVLIRRSCFDRVGAFKEDRALWGAEDLEFFLRLTKVYAFGCVPKPLITRYIREEQASIERQARYLEATVQIYRTIDIKGQDQIRWLDKVRKVADLHHFVACFYRDHGAYWQAARHFGQALLTYPPIGVYLSKGPLTRQQQLRQALAPLRQGAACLLKAFNANDKRRIANI